MITCKDCGSENVQKRGFNNNRTKQRIECQSCGAWSSVDIEVLSSEPKVFKNILIFDIETMVKKAFLFRPGKQYVNADSFIDYDTMICWSAKVLGSSDTFSDCLTSKEAKEKNHSRITKSLWNLMKDYDVTVSHNGINFDIPMIRTFFLKENLGLPNRFRNIDTCQIARSNFRFQSNRLDYICRELGLNDGKTDTNIDLWKKCYDGDQESLDYMQTYNINDILILEDLLNIFKPYIPSFPNVAVYGDIEESQCPYCGGANFKDNGYWFTPNGKFNSYRCECKAIFRSKENLLTKTKKKVQMVGI